ncbi:low molecular weight protein-tyrosine-phosphatase [Maliponia aquimaris]|uniref:protein-tyrosine-phosphatase n=1 Tax=Maliponia aquimaris TaxID=1673631 RepID=A0A238L2Z5_9RHOB|nr:low molecular weight protein-tyrosine-phosphatase [Maliponia aquimaris]SMX49230.1 Low molecular weight protein-tyrosine-phosphatase YfkJ [Maliponia aquimaris]
MAYRILFVCLGNICRSPAAEAVVRSKAAARGVALDLDSAGTGDWHIGSPPYGPMQQAGAARGYDLSPLRARQVSRADFGRFDLIVAMDGQNLADLRRLARTGGASLRLFTDYAPQTGADHVPDPYYTRDFDGALDLIEACAEGLLDQL